MGQIYDTTRITGSLTRKPVQITNHKPNVDEWQCVMCRSIQTIYIDDSECVICGHNKALNFDDEWQCPNCLLIQSQSIPICQFCKHRNYNILNRIISQLGNTGNAETPTICNSNKQKCRICGCNLYNNTIIWNFDKGIICTDCYNIVSLHDVIQCDINTCYHLKRFILLMNIYNNDIKTIADNMQFIGMIDDDHYHLSEKHGDEDGFKYIVDKLGKCHITKCQACDAPKTKIERIHCHYQHYFGCVAGDESMRFCEDDKEICIICNKDSTANDIFMSCTLGTVCEHCYETAQESNHLHLNSKCKLSNCYQLERFLLVINRYNKCNVDKEEEYIPNISCILNAYLHLIHKHEEEFDYIANKLSVCDWKNCKSYLRNNRNKDIESESTEEKKIEKDSKDATYGQIMDKIHCYFNHGYDTGNRLSQKERNTVQYEMKQIQQANCGYSINYQKKKLAEILQRKHANKSSYITNRSNRYSQLIEQIEVTEVTNSKEQKNCHQPIVNMYNFGYLFLYGYERENEVKNLKMTSEEIDYIKNTLFIQAIKVNPKYQSLKEELIRNKMATLNAEQFESEYIKAMIHYESYHRKQHYKDFELEMILSLMIYCAYDDLQYKFSKTYRENDGKSHSNFYYMGKNLKISVHGIGDKMREFGCCPHKHDDQKFYHGVSDKLAFPSYGLTMQSRSRYHVGISIHGPLSTSSSYAVAANFTNYNQGLVIEFMDNECHNASPKSLSLEWLSDFPDEKEHLFIQNLFHFQIKSIIEVEYGWEYNMILEALKYDVSGYIFKSNRNESENTKESRKILSNALILNQLYLSKTKLSIFGKSFDTLSQYAQTICNIYFSNVEYINIKYLQWDDLGFWCRCNNYIYIKLELIQALFVNIKKIELISVKLCQMNLQIYCQYLMHSEGLKEIAIADDGNFIKNFKLNSKALNQMKDKLQIYIENDIITIKQIKSK